MTDKSGKTVVEKSTSEPSDFIKPDMRFVLDAARNNYQQGWGNTYYPGQTTTPFSMASQEAMGGMLQTARGGNPAGMNAINANMGITGNQGISQGILQGIAPAANVASGQNRITTGDEYARMAANAQFPTASSGLSGLATQGANLGGITTLGGYSNAAQRAGQQSASENYGQQVARGDFAPSTAASRTLANRGAMAGQLTTGADYRNELGAMGQPGANETYLTGMARGNELGAGNPYISGIADATERRAMDQASAMFSVAGRYGPNAAFGDAVGRALSESRNSLYAQDYENARQRQLAASGMIDQSQLGRAGQRQGLLAGLTGVQGQNIANEFQDAGLRLGAEAQAGQLGLADAASRMGAAGQMDQSRLGLLNTQLSALGGQTQAQQLNNQNALANAGLRVGAAGQIDQANAQQLQGALAALGGQTQTQAANIANQVGAGQNIVDAYGQGQQRSLAAQGLSGDLYQNTFAPYERMAQVGSAQEGLAREQLAADIDRWNFNQNAPWTNLGRLGSFVNGGQFGQSNTTSAPGQSPIQGLLSGGAAGAGLAGALGLSGPWGWGAAGLGGLLGLLG